MVTLFVQKRSSVLNNSTIQFTSKNQLFDLRGQWLHPWTKLVRCNFRKPSSLTKPLSGAVNGPAMTKSSCALTHSPEEQRLVFQALLDYNEPSSSSFVHTHVWSHWGVTYDGAKLQRWSTGSHDIVITLGNGGGHWLAERDGRCMLSGQPTIVLRS